MRKGRRQPQGYTFHQMQAKLLFGHIVSYRCTEVPVERNGRNLPHLMSPSNRAVEISQVLAQLVQCHQTQVSDVNSGIAEAT